MLNLACARDWLPAREHSSGRGPCFCRVKETPVFAAQQVVIQEEMARHRVLSLKEIDNIINDDAFLSSDEGADDNGPIDVVELPPERVDEDNEDIDDNILDDDEPADVPGPVEIHRAERRDDHVIVAIASPSTSTATNDTAPPPAKRRVVPLNPKWGKRQPIYSKTYRNCDVVEKRRCDIINLLKGKSPVQCFEKLFDDAIIADIVRQTVTYATQKNAHQFFLSSDCVRKFFGFFSSLGTTAFLKNNCTGVKMKILMFKV
ncbi:hypothetical protein Btru_075594 [Bulinus truncatus]|nr:hypothetical protein Btru_075594 [Bulinus truncatus]